MSSQPQSSAKCSSLGASAPPESTPTEAEKASLPSDTERTLAGGRREKQETKSQPVRNPSLSSESSTAADSAPSRTQKNVDTLNRSTSAISEAEFPSGAMRYQDRFEIGRGGCGVVVRAYDRQLQREVVIKRIIPGSPNSAELEARFLNEARITGGLEHPGIVPVYEIGRDQQSMVPFYAMKWIQGETFSETIANYQRLSRLNNRRLRFHELLSRFLQVCQTLAYAHQMRVVHRDLKPANIIVGQFGSTVVLDWGLAKYVDESSSNSEASSSTLELVSTLINEGSDWSTILDLCSQEIAESLKTRQGSIMGTAAYMSPEQARGETQRISFPSDVFSLGVILYEILSGKSPFRSETLGLTLERVARADFKPLGQIRKGIPRPLQAICYRALAANMEDRYPDAQGLATDIQNYLVGAPVNAYREPWWAKLDRMAGNHKTVVRSTFGALCTICAVSIVSLGLVKQAHESEKVAHRLAVQESEQRQLALVREERAHAQAIEQLQSARQAVDVWLIELSGDLQFYPGLGPLRAQLIERAKTYYAHNAKQQIMTPLHAIEVARAQIRLGDLVRLSEDYHEAMGFYNAAKELLNDQDASGNDSWSAMVAKQAANAAIGIALCATEHDEDLGLDPHAAETALQLAMQVYDRFPADIEASNILARAQQSHSRASAMRNALPTAIETVDEAISNARRIYAERGEPRDFRLLVTLLEDQGRYFRMAGDLSRAVGTYQQAESLYSERIDTQVKQPDWLESRAHLALKIGDCLSKLQKPKLAVRYFEQAENDLRTAWDMLYGETYFRENLAIAKADIGFAQLQSGCLADSEKSLRDAIEMLQWLVQHEGADNDRIQRMAQCFLGLASAMSKPPSDELVKLLQDSGVLIDHLANQPEFIGRAASMRSLRSWLLVLKASREQLWDDVATISAEALEDLKQSESNRLMSSETAWLFAGRFSNALAKARSERSDDDGRDRFSLQAREYWLRAFEAREPTPAFLAGKHLVEDLCENSTDQGYEPAMRIALELTRRFDSQPGGWFLLAQVALLQQKSEVAEEALQKARERRTGQSPSDARLEKEIRAASKAS